MNSIVKIALLGLLAACLSETPAEARPYFYFQEAAQPPAAAPAPINTVTVPENAATDAGTSLPDDPEHPLPQRITGHLGELYTHGSSVVKTLAENVQPDIKNIGQDLTDVYHATRDNVNKKIKPLAQTMRPFIENAHKAVSPLMEQAKEEVPRALSKVADKARGAWEKFTAGSAPSVEQQAQQAGVQIQQVGNQIQQAGSQVASNAANHPDQATSATQA